MQLESASSSSLFEACNWSALGSAASDKVLHPPKRMMNMYRNAAPHAWPQMVIQGALEAASVDTILQHEHA